jgi:hypothetical protein
MYLREERTILLVVSAQVRRQQARFAMERGLSQRRACALMQVSRSSLAYELKMPVKNESVVQAMRTLSGIYPRFGSRRIRVLLGREGMVMGQERCAALWAQAGLQVPKKRRRRRVACGRPRPYVSTPTETCPTFRGFAEVNLTHPGPVSRGRFRACLRGRLSRLSLVLQSIALAADLHDVSVM